MPPMLMKHLTDPADDIKAKVGDLKDFELFGVWVLIGIYMRPNITKSGIHLADVTIKEDQWQGKAALLLKAGPAAFVSDENHDFRGQRAAVGDWVCVHVGDGKSIMIRGQPCRLVRDQDIVLKIPAPDQIF